MVVTSKSGGRKTPAHWHDEFLRVARSGRAVSIFVEHKKPRSCGIEIDGGDAYYDGAMLLQVRLALYRQVRSIVDLSLTCKL